MAPAGITVCASILFYIWKKPFYMKKTNIAYMSCHFEIFCIKTFAIIKNDLRDNLSINMLFISLDTLLLATSKNPHAEYGARSLITFCNQHKNFFFI